MVLSKEPSCYRLGSLVLSRSYFLEEKVSTRILWNTVAVHAYHIGVKSLIESHLNSGALAVSYTTNCV